MKKTLKWMIILILLDMTVGTAIMYLFDVEKFADQYPGEVLFGIVVIGIIYIGVKTYRRLRFNDLKHGVRIQFLEG